MASRGLRETFLITLRWIRFSGGSAPLNPFRSVEKSSSVPIGHMVGRERWKPVGEENCLLPTSPWASVGVKNGLWDFQKGWLTVSVAGHYGGVASSGQHFKKKKKSLTLHTIEFNWISKKTIVNKNLWTSNDIIFQEVTANIYKSRNLPNTDTQYYNTDLR